MRYALLIPDGAADYPQTELGGKTPLQVAKIPALDFMAQNGEGGLAQTIPDGMPAGSDVAALTILGYDAPKFYSGRAPLEAAAQNIKLAPTEIVFRANTVTIRDGKMIDFAGGHLSDDAVTPLIDYLAENLNIDGVKLKRGVSYRHLCIIDNFKNPAVKTVPPHDITNQAIAPHLPADDLLQKITNRSAELLQKINAPFTHLWLWSGGKMPELPTYPDLYHLRGAMISAVDLLRGIARLANLQVINVDGATGFYDTNYRGKGLAAVEFLRENDLVIVHVEAPDEAGHNGEAHEKIRAIENFDKYIAAPLLTEAQKSNDLRILCLPDHYTPLNLRTHTREPVPYILYGAEITPQPAKNFSEDAYRDKTIIVGKDLIGKLFRGG